MTDKIIQITATKGNVYGLSQSGRLWKLTNDMGVEWRLIVTSEDQDKYEDIDKADGRI